MGTFRDQIGRMVEISERPQRIVSLVPSITELLCDLGGEDALVGLTRFCVHPAGIRNVKARVGGTKDLKLDEIRYLSPDLIIASKEENVKGQVLELSDEYPVWVSDVGAFNDALQLIDFVGDVLQSKGAAHKMLKEIDEGYGHLAAGYPQKSPKTALYLIWKPYMAAGTDTFISSMMEQVGLQNVLASLGEQGLRYPRLEMSDIAALAPDFILLSSEPYPFKPEHLEGLKPLANNSALLVDGEAFSWYGSRMLHKLPYLRKFRDDIAVGV